LWIGWSRFGLATDNDSLYTFSFLLLLYFAVFSVVSARERHWFWSTMPSKTFLAALSGDAVIGTVLTLVGLPGLKALPPRQTLEIFAYAAAACLIVNDAVKVAMIKWRVLNVIAKPKPEANAEPKPEAKSEPKPEPTAEPKPKASSDLTPQLVKRVHELYEELGREEVRAVEDMEQAERESGKKK